MIRQVKVDKDSETKCAHVALQSCLLCQSFQITYIGPIEDFQDPKKVKAARRTESGVANQVRPCQICSRATDEAIQAGNESLEKGLDTPPVPMAVGWCHTVATMPLFIPVEVLKTLTPGQIFTDPAAWPLLRDTLKACAQRTQLHVRKLLEQISE